MDKLAEYSQIIESVLQNHAKIPHSYGEIHNSVVIDAERKNFLLMIEGWEKHRRVHGCLVHVQIIDNKIWIQRDGLEDGITGELEEAGIPKDKIVLGFYPAHVRPHTGYAVA
ncbi:XisI protein [Pseudanabaena sp. PCC 6802]|uniref:XisI protein n=1 Tax=Pseudanabaena sp. PCC 6802 TaxID=118173 RepID=UPI00037FA243|nr:XisI protein [Pseudanabaena sp. PCC 6802]